MAACGAPVVATERERLQILGWFMKSQKEPLSRLANQRPKTRGNFLEGSPGWRIAVDGRVDFFREPAEWRAIEDAGAGRISLDEFERLLLATSMC
jgi:hypothetical protein